MCLFRHSCPNYYAMHLIITLPRRTPARIQKTRHMRSIMSQLRCLAQTDATPRYLFAQSLNMAMEGRSKKDIIENVDEIEMEGEGEWPKR